jgi:2-oxo-3-hexenedioate decarboxylase
MTSFDRERIGTLAAALIDAWDGPHAIAPITASDPSFDIPAAYQVLHEIQTRRRAQGWKPVGRKIGFTNRTIWPRYGVHVPMWAHVFEHTVTHGREGHVTLRIERCVQPRIEPEIVFGLRAEVHGSYSVRAVLDAVDWMAPGFEVVQSHFPDWKFKAPDCTAAFGLHGVLGVGERVYLDDAQRDRLVDVLPRFEVTLRRAGQVVDRGVGANVLDGPDHALLHLARLLDGQAWAPPLQAGEIVTTGTITDAWPVRAGETWRSDYGALAAFGVHGLQATFE